MASRSLLFTLSHCPAPLPIPKYECIARPKGRLLLPPALAPAHAALTTRHECDNLMEDERENKARTKEIANLLYRLGGTRFSCEQSGTEERGDSRRCGQVWAALWQWRRRRHGGRSLCFIIKAAKSLPLFAMRCAEPMDGCRRWLLSPSLFVLSPSWTSQRSSKAYQDTDMFRCQLFQICLLNIPYLNHIESNRFARYPG